MVQCRVEPFSLQVQQGRPFRINITARGSPKPSLQMIQNKFAASWRKIREYEGNYWESIELEVARARMDESKRYNLGTAVQIDNGRQQTDNCIFYLNVTGISWTVSYIMKTLYINLLMHIEKVVPNCLKVYISNRRACHGKMVGICPNIHLSTYLPACLPACLCMCVCL
jgi:hypothetical protein